MLAESRGTLSSSVWTSGMHSGWLADCGHGGGGCRSGSRKRGGFCGRGDDWTHAYHLSAVLARIGMGEPDGKGPEPLPYAGLILGTGLASVLGVTVLALGYYDAGRVALQGRHGWVGAGLALAVWAALARAAAFLGAAVILGLGMPWILHRKRERRSGAELA